MKLYIYQGRFSSFTLKKSSHVFQMSWTYDWTATLTLRARLDSRVRSISNVWTDLPLQRSILYFRHYMFLWQYFRSPTSSRSPPRLKLSFLVSLPYSFDVSLRILFLYMKPYFSKALHAAYFWDSQRSRAPFQSLTVPCDSLIESGIWNIWKIEEKLKFFWASLFYEW